MSTAKSRCRPEVVSSVLPKSLPFPKRRDSRREGRHLLFSSPAGRVVDRVPSRGSSARPVSFDFGSLNGDWLRPSADGACPPCLTHFALTLGR